MPTVLVLIAIPVFAAVLLYRMEPLLVTVFEYEKGIKYDKGKFIAVLEPGRYLRNPVSATIRKIDCRPRFVSITGQEVLSADSVTIKVSIAANYEVTDPARAVNKVKDYEGALYLELQLALREIVGALDIEGVLGGRNDISRRLFDAAEKKAEALGLRLISANLKDIMFPGKLKETFALSVKARKEGAAALERARGETAALRNLANAARMVESNPNLLQLRLFQALGESSGHTVIVGMPSQTTPVPIPAKEKDTAIAPSPSDPPDSAGSSLKD